MNTLPRPDGRIAEMTQETIEPDLYFRPMRTYFENDTHTHTHTRPTEIMVPKQEYRKGFPGKPGNIMSAAVLKL
jgi:hypothetical protein